ncbi:unnamed protein product [Brachionus calyciflorus]|uniref:SWIM-type domain-containing protein n=1 Tax=Brachionus calyciflorus TaxID=104777 RepID=A0A813XC16_9BILA|nr:unnamed protein product [Brachionus calyciflorus]
MNVCELMATILVDCTKSQTHFDLGLRHNNSMVRNSIVYGEANFIKITGNTFYYSADGMRKYYLQLDPKFCSCSKFYLEAICRHYIALAIVNNITVFPGLLPHPSMAITSILPQS